MLIRYQKLSFSCSFLYFSLISNADQAHIRSPKLPFSCRFLYVSLISKPHQISKTFIFKRFLIFSTLLKFSVLKFINLNPRLTSDPAGGIISKTEIA